MNQHFNSMLEHLSSLRRKNSESAPASSHEKQADSDHKESSDVESVNSKSKNSIFKNLISDNGATNIFQNFIKCPENLSSHLSTAMSSSSNGNCKPKTNDADSIIQQAVCDEKVVEVVLPVATNGIHKKRNSTVKMLQTSNGDTVLRDLSPALRVHRKSSHDIRLLRNNQHGENGEIIEVGKVTGVKPLKTKNILTKNETFDTLHCQAMDVSICAITV